MSIENLINQIAADPDMCYMAPACSEKEIAAASAKFQRLTGIPLPEAFKSVLRRTNGLDHNGLVIWPVSQQEGFQETLFQANEELRDSFDDRYAYFAQRDEDLFYFDPGDNRYHVMAMMGRNELEVFDDAAALLEYALKEAFE